MIKTTYSIERVPKFEVNILYDKVQDCSSIRTSIRRIIAEDLKLQPFKKIEGQRMDTRAKQKRIERCPNLLGVSTKQVLETAFFIDEKIFKVTQLLNVQNDRTYAPSAYKKSTIENKRLYVERSGFL